MYIFGGSNESGDDLGDLGAFWISKRRWYTFQNMGPSPSPRSGHSMCTHEDRIYVIGGLPSLAPEEPEEFKFMYILDTSKIRYPQDEILPKSSRFPVTSSGVAAMHPERTSYLDRQFPPVPKPRNFSRPLKPQLEPVPTDTDDDNTEWHQSGY